VIYTIISKCRFTGCFLGAFRVILYFLNDIHCREESQVKMNTSKKTNSKGAGYIFKRGSMYYLQYDVNGSRKKISLGVKNRRDAENKAKEILEPLREGTTKEKIAVHIGNARNLLSSRKLIFEEVWDKFAIKLRKDLGKDTVGNYKRQWEAFKSWLYKNHAEITELSQVTSEMALEYADKLDKVDRLSTSSFNQHRGTLSRLFHLLSKEVGITENPMFVVESKSTPGISRKELTEKQITMVLGKFDDPNFNMMHKDEMRVLFHIGTWTGLRLKDCVLMKWDDIDFKRNRIFCVPVKTRTHGNTVIIPIHPILLKELKKALTWQTNEYVLPNAAPRYIRVPSTFKKDVVRVFFECGFETSKQVENRKKRTNVIGFHSLRHSFVSFCAKAGVPLPVVQAIVGHGNPAMTRHYIHIGEESVKQAINALPQGNMLSGAKKEKTTEEKNQEAIVLLKSKPQLTETEMRLLKILQ